MEGAVAAWVVCFRKIITCFIIMQKMRLCVCVCGVCVRCVCTCVEKKSRYSGFPRAIVLTLASM